MYNSTMPRGFCQGLTCIFLQFALLSRYRADLLSYRAGACRCVRKHGVSLYPGLLLRGRPIWGTFLKESPPYPPKNFLLVPFIADATDAAYGIAKQFQEAAVISFTRIAGDGCAPVRRMHRFSRARGAGEAVRLACDRGPRVSGLPRRERSSEPPAADSRGLRKDIPFIEVLEGGLGVTS